MAFPATFGSIRTAVIEKMRLHATDDLTRTGDWVNQVYSQVCVETEAIQSSLVATLTANAASYTIDPDIARIKQIVATTGGSTGRPLQALNSIQIRELRANNGATAQTGSVSHYALLGLSQIEFWPTPYAADLVTIDSVMFPTALSASGDVPVLPEPFSSKLLEYGALAEAADFLKHPQLAEYRQLYEYWMRKLVTHKNSKLGGHVQQMPMVAVEGAWADNSRDTGA